MDPVYHSLASALQRRLAVIGDRALRESDSAAHLGQLKSASEQILQLQEQLPADCDPHLLHYMENCSYDKALALLQKRFSA
jgi:hypothetical protein